MKRWLLLFPLVLFTSMASAQYYQVTLRAELKSDNNDVECDSWIKVTFETPGIPLEWFEKIKLPRGQWGHYDASFIIHADSMFTRITSASRRDLSNCDLADRGERSYTIPRESFPCMDMTWGASFPGYDGASTLRMTITPATAKHSAPGPVWATTTSAVLLMTENLNNFEYTVTATYEDNTTQELLTRDKQDLPRAWQIFNRSSSTSFTRKRIKKITVRSEKFGIPTPDVMVREYAVSDNGHDLSIKLEKQPQHPLPHNSPLSTVHVRVFRPKTPVTATSSILPSNNDITITVNENHNDYQWQYSLDSATWQNLPASVGNTNRITVSGEKIFGINGWKTQVFRNVFIKALYRCSPGFETSSVTLRHLPSAPGIASVEGISETCAGSGDAGFKIKLDRPLYTGANLGVTYDEVVFVSVDGEEKPLGAPPDADNIVIVTDADIRPGSHTIRISNHFGAIGPGYSDGSIHRRVGTIAARPAVSNLSYNATHVLCNGGASGALSFSASGGTGAFRAYLVHGANELSNISFTQGGTYSFSGLAAGEYTIRFSDTNGCIPQNGIDRATVSINEPATPVSVHATENTEPLGHGLENGHVTVRAVGGTYPYAFNWYDESASSLTGDPPASEGQSMTATLSNIGKGKYFIEVRDTRYSTVSPALPANLRGCYDTLTILVEEPPLLEVFLKEHHFVSCNGYANGEIEANAKGGRPYIAPHQYAPYQFEWYLVENGSSILFNQTDSIAVDRRSGWYRVKVTDRNGISAWSQDFFLQQPDVLRMDFQTSELDCNGDSDGVSEVLPLGGTSPYSYQWSTGETAKTVSGLTDGVYSVVVTDTRGCTSFGTTNVVVPDGIQTEAMLRSPTCHLSADGSISLEVNGGAGGYEYAWAHGGSVATTQGLSEGEYSVTITDANGCHVTLSYTLDDPDLFPVEISGSRVLCRGQVLSLNASIEDNAATYSWRRNGALFSSSPSVDITDPGEYSVIVTNGAGCENSGAIHITTTDVEISADFVVATKVPAGQPVKITNISYPYPDRSQWLLPQDVEILSESIGYVEMIFPALGDYEIGLISYRGDCEKTVFKTVSAVDSRQLADYVTPDEPFIKQFIVSPNPNDGLFKVNVELKEASGFRLILYSPQGNVVEQREVTNTAVSEVSFDVRRTVSGGVYLVQLITREGTATAKLIIE